MHFVKLIPAVLVSAGVALGLPPAEDSSKLPPPPGSTVATDRTPAPTPPSNLRYLPPVMRNAEKGDSLLLVLPGGPAAPAEDPAPPAAAAARPAPPPPAEDPERPVLHRGTPAYPAEFGSESALFCQKQIGEWTLDDAAALLGEPKRHRVSLNDDGLENGDIYAFSDASSRYRELELDFDRETGFLRSVFAYPWKMTWQECRKIWGARVSATDADKGRKFYSYLDRRLDVLVDQAGKVINFGLY